jgi:hypothetical protein
MYAADCKFAFIQQIGMQCFCSEQPLRIENFTEHGNFANKVRTTMILLVCFDLIGYLHQFVTLFKDVCDCV